jgi:hypothetical protein
MNGTVTLKHQNFEEWTGFFGNKNVITYAAKDIRSSIAVVIPAWVQSFSKSATIPNQTPESTIVGNANVCIS